jgi:hypothetical protein
LLRKEVIKNVKSETETSTQIETSDESSNRAGKKMSLTVFYRNLRKYQRKIITASKIGRENLEEEESIHSEQQQTSCFISCFTSRVIQHLMWLVLFLK